MFKSGIFDAVGQESKVFFLNDHLNWNVSVVIFEQL